MGKSMNDVDPNMGTPLHLKLFEWIRTTLSHLQDEAAVWATPAMEEMANGGTPFNRSWANFTAAFKARFETVNEAVNTKEILWQLTHSSKTVPEDTAKFKEVMDCTGYSAVDLHNRFYNGLLSKMKDELTHTEDIALQYQSRTCYGANTLSSSTLVWTSSGRCTPQNTYHRPAYPSIKTPVVGAQPC